MRFFFWSCCGLLQLAATAAQAQAAPPAANRRVEVVSGKLRPGFFFDLGPGNGCALRFAPPAGAARRLVSVQVQFNSFERRVAQGRVRLRVASIGSGGAPATDDLLAQPVIVDTPTLQTLDHPLTLSWPAIEVPAAGFFVVAEGVGDSPDEYVLRSPALVLAGAGNNQVGRRTQPGATPRLLSTWSIPMLRGAKPDRLPATVWLSGGPTPNHWQADSTARRVPLLSVSFE